MQCDICKRLPSSRLPFNCELCAQAFAYPSRLALAQSLLKNEALENEVESCLDGASSGKKPAPKAKAPDANPACVLGRVSAEHVVATERANLASDHILNLRSEIKQMRLDIAKRKSKLQKRQRGLAASKKELTEAHSSRRETVQGEIRAIQRNWEDLHQQTIQQRVAHCTQTARLYSLQLHKRRTRAGGKDTYSIGFVPIVDLRDLNSATPLELSTALLHLANLVHLISHHLALKLPAQIILPHSQCPYPLILTPISSYKGGPTTRPTVKLPLVLNPPQKSSHPHAPLARPLFLEKKLSYAKPADQAIYSQAVEGMTLLAWDIAWLCKTQGLDIGSEHWEDVCAMGKNLWQLLLAPTSRPAIPRDEDTMTTPARKHLSRTTTTESTPPRKEQDSKATADAPPPPPPPLGFFSHGTAAGYLAAEPGVTYMSDWKLQRPVNIIKKVEAMLIAEQTGAGWEILEGGEWEEEGEQQQEAAAPVMANHQNGHAEAPTRVEETGILVKPVVAAADARRDSDREDERAKGTSGWTKLKNR